MIHFAGTNQEVLPTEVFKQYMSEHPNVKIEAITGAARYAAILAAYRDTRLPIVNAGYFNGDATARGDLLDMFMELDPKRIPNMNEIPPAYRRPGNRGSGALVVGVGIAYRKDLVSPPPTSWTDLLAPRFKGKVGIYDAPLAFTFGGILPVNRILGGTDKDPERGFKAYSDAARAGQFRLVYNSNQTQKDAFIKGEVVIGGACKCNAGPWEEEGAPIGYVVPKEGQIALPLNVAIVRNSSPQQIYHAEEILNRWLSPDYFARYAELTYTASVSAKVKLPAKLQNDPAFSSENILGAMAIDWGELANRQTEWLEWWNKEFKARLQ